MRRIPTASCASRKSHLSKNVLSRNWGSDPRVHDARIVPTDTVTVEPLPTQSPAEIASQAILSRPEYQAAKIQLTNTEISLQGTKNELRPELDLVGNVQNNGLAGSVIPLWRRSPRVHITDWRRLRNRPRATLQVRLPDLQRGTESDSAHS